MYSQASHSAASKRSAQPQRSYTRMASVAAPPSAGPSPSKATAAGSSWDDDHGAPQPSSCGTMFAEVSVAGGSQDAAAAQGAQPLLGTAETATG